MRRHLPSRRARRRVLAAPFLLLVLAGGLQAVPSVAAQAVPTLEAAFVQADDTVEGEDFSTAGDCVPGGSSTFTFEAAGPAGGSLEGTFTESGTVTLGTTPSGGQTVTAFEAAFMIHTTNGYTITGTKRLTGSRSALCLPEGSPEGRVVNFHVDLDYEAAITGPGGSFAVAGTAVARATDASPGTLFPDGEHKFQETFVTSTPIELGPASLELAPATATNAVETEHCVRATVLDALGHRILGGVVRFSVTGASTASGDGEIESGEARFCYDGPAEPGVDTIRAFADANGNGAEDDGEPAGEATATWVALARPPAALALDPADATHPVGAEHCVTATVTDTVGAPSVDVRIHFSVTGVSSAGGSGPTGADGTAAFCYAGPSEPGTDTIRAFADTDGNGVQDPGEPAAEATATFEPVARPAVSLALEPVAGTSPVDAEHCVTAIAHAAGGEPADPAVVRFAVTGASTASGGVVTDAAGEARFCYAGPAFPGEDAIRAFADLDGDGAESPGEPAADAAATFVLPASAPGCSVTFGGRIQAADGKGTFGGNALGRETGAPSGRSEYRDHGTGLTLKGEEVLAVTCDAAGRRATVYGRGTLQGGGTALFRLRVADLAEPGAGTDTYGILLDSGYDSGEGVLEGGNIQVRGT